VLYGNRHRIIVEHDKSLIAMPSKPFILAVDSSLAGYFSGNPSRWKTVLVFSLILLWLACLALRFIKVDTPALLVIFMLVGSALIDLVSNRYLGPRSNRQNLAIITLMLVLSVGLCLSQLFSVWHAGTSNDYCIGGFIPFNDASNYYSGARSLLEFGTLDPVSLRRPLAPCFYSFLLFLTSQNLQAVLLINALFLGCAITFASWAIFSTHGLTAALVMVLSLCGFSSDFIMAPLTEPVALLFAALAFAFLWMGFFKSRKLLVCSGIFLLSLSLAIRVGPVWIVPLLAAWAGFVFREKGKFSWKLFVVGISLLAAIIVANYSAVHVLAPGKSGGFNSNFSVSLYGLSKGGVGWWRFSMDHDSLMKSGASEYVVTSTAYKESFDNIIHTPHLILRGIARMHWYFLKNIQKWFCPLSSFIGSIPAVLLFFVCCWFFIRSWKKNQALVILVSLTVISVWLGAPLYADINNRVLTAVWPLLCAVTAVGIGLIIGALSGKKNQPEDILSQKAWTALAWTVVAGAIIFLSLPFLVRLAARMPDVSLLKKSSAPCFTQPDTGIAMFRASRNSFLHILPDSGSRMVPEIRVSSYRASAGAFFENAHEGQYIGNIFNLIGPNRILYVILNEDPARYAGKFIAVSLRFIGARECGHTVYHGRICNVLDSK
jgi:hypothetical protein